MYQNVVWIGWLLASDAPKNISKGKRLLSKLSLERQNKCKAQARHLKAMYKSYQS